jgi:putative (di)nucleoside polyphosphate hydrolase
MTEQKLPYRPNVCLLVCNRDGLIFLGKRHGSVDVWQLPQGGIDKDEDLETAALREGTEELGVDRELLSLLTILEVVHAYDFDRPRSYGSKEYRGQLQRFVVIHFTGTDSDINLSRYEQELDEYQWCTTNELMERGEGQRCIGYSKAIKELEAKKYIVSGRINLFGE